MRKYPICVSTMAQHMTSEELKQISLFSEIKGKALQDVLAGKFRQLFNLKFQLGLLGDDPYGRPYSDMQAAIHEMKAQLKEQKKSVEFLWITINVSPQWIRSELEKIYHLATEVAESEAQGGPTGDSEGEDVDYSVIRQECMTEVMSVLEKKLLKFQKSSMFLSSIGVIEQRESVFDPDKTWMGQHVHILAKRIPTYFPSKIEFETRARWCDFVGDVKKQIHIVRCPTKFASDKLTYMLGEKTGTDSSGEVRR